MHKNRLTEINILKDIPAEVTSIRLQYLGKSLNWPQFDQIPLIKSWNNEHLHMLLIWLGNYMLYIAVYMLITVSHTVSQITVFSEMLEPEGFEISLP